MLPVLVLVWPEQSKRLVRGRVKGGLRQSVRLVLVRCLKWLPRMLLSVVMKKKRLLKVSSGLTMVRLFLCFV